MPARVRIPSYRLHKSTGRAVVTFDGRDRYLGKYGTPESQQLYGQLIARYAAGLPLEVDSAEPPKLAPGLPLPPGFESYGLTINELCSAFFKHAVTYYVKNGKITDEVGCLESASKPLILLYGDTDVGLFGAIALEAVRNKMIDLGWSRGYINRSVSRIRTIFRFGVRKDLFPPAVVQRLQSVPALLSGRTEAVDLPARSFVPADHLEAVRNDVNEQTRDMMDVALLTGARPGELCMLTGEMINRKKEVWIVDLEGHKMAHTGKKRILAFGPKSQLILRRYLKADPRRKLFSISRKRFSETIKQSCERLGLPVFTGHWLRHNAATAIRKEFGLDEAQNALGHSSQKTTEIYAHLDPDELIALARKRG